MKRCEVIFTFTAGAVLAALGGWLGVKQFLLVAGLLVVAGVLLVNIVME